MHLDGACLSRPDKWSAILSWMQAGLSLEFVRTNTILRRATRPAAYGMVDKHAVYVGSLRRDGHSAPAKSPILLAPEWKSKAS